MRNIFGIIKLVFLLGTPMCFYFFSSCSKSDLCADNESTTVPIEIFSDSLYCRLQIADSITSSEGVHVIIENQDDLKKYVYCVKGLPSVDFNSNFVIAGKVFWPKCAHISDLKLTNCSFLTLAITVDATGDGGMTCGSEVVLYYFIKVNKKYSTNIKYEVHEKK